MKIQSTNNSPERILAYGTYNAGKTYAWFQILNSTPDDVLCYVIDTDQTVNPYLDSEEFSHLSDRIILCEPYGWEDWIDFLKHKVHANIKPGDWLVVDMADEAWDAVQRYYTEKVYGEDLGDFWLNYLAEGGDSKTAMDTTDWQAVNKMYNTFENAILRQPGHLFMATPEKKIGPYEETANKKQYEGKAKKWKPAGQKHLGHIPRTVLRFHGHRYTTIKDRQREDQTARKITDFAKDYLVAVGGWRPVKNGDDNG